MTNTEFIRVYFKRFFSGKARHSDVRNLLTDDFQFFDPLLSANSADEYVNRLKSFGDELDMHVDVKEIIGEGDIVAALVDFHGPSGKMAYAQWFTFRGGKIAALRVIYDPRPFTEAPPRK
jgi:ketosteroid isomerase-like protein